MRTAAVLAFPGISPFHLSVPLMVFGGVGVRSVEAAYRVVTVAEHPGAVRTAAGLDLLVTDGLDLLATADLVVLPSWDPDLVPSAEGSKSYWISSCAPAVSLALLAAGRVSDAARG